MARFFCGLVAVLFSVGGAWAGERLNVLLLLVDDLKPALGCYGDDLAITPNIDRLAARGVRFERAYCNQAVCAPSRNNLLLGSRSTSIGVYSLGLNFRRAVPEAVTLPQLFMEHGWHSGAVGKVFHTGHGNHEDRASWSVEPRLEKVVEYLLPESTGGGKLTREDAYFTNRNLGRIRQLPRGAAWEIADVGDSAYSDGRIADEGIRRLRRSVLGGEGPFFLALGFVKPHLPFTAPERYWDLHDPAAFPLSGAQEHPEGAPDWAGKRGGEIANYTPVTVENLRDEAMQRRLIHGYYAAVSYADAQIGRVLDEMERLGLMRSTVVVLWGDHGWHLGDHGYWTKHTNYEEANRIPVIIAAPGMVRGRAAGQLTETVDIYPTLAELAGLPQPEGRQPIDGISLVPVLQDPSRSLRDHAYHCYPKRGYMGRAVRTERFRLVEWKRRDGTGGPVHELYDYIDDPGESRNLAAERPGEVARLKAVLARHPEAADRN